MELFANFNVVKDVVMKTSSDGFLNFVLLYFSNRAEALRLISSLRDKYIDEKKIALSYRYFFPMSVSSFHHHFPQRKQREMCGFR